MTEPWNIRRRTLLLGTIVGLSFPVLAQASGQTGKGRRLKRVLVYGDSNTYGSMTNALGKVQRLDPEKTWPGVMQLELGADWVVIAEGLSGRTTNLDRPIQNGTGRLTGNVLNGQAVLPAILSSHSPLDLVIIMLGTQDMHRDFDREAKDIAGALEEMAAYVQSGAWQANTNFARPKVLLVSPVKPNLQGKEAERYFPRARETSQLLPEQIQTAANHCHCAFFDASGVVPFAEQADGLHLSEANHQALGLAMAEQVRALFAVTPTAGE